MSERQRTRAQWRGHTGDRIVAVVIADKAGNAGLLKDRLEEADARMILVDEYLSHEIGRKNNGLSTPNENKMSDGASLKWRS